MKEELPAQESAPLFATDLKRFWELITTDDPAVRIEALKSNLEDLALCEILRYGYYNDEKMITPLAQFYCEMVVPMTDEKRLKLQNHVVGFMENTDVISINALLPFISEDKSRGIVSSAVISYVSLGPLTGGDPMSRVKEIVDMFERGILENEGAAFGGLLYLGDNRVCRLLVPLRDQLDRDALQEMIYCYTGFLHEATVDFYLDWLESLEGSDEDGTFGLVAVGLSLMKRNSHQGDVISTGYRPIPSRGVSPDEFREAIKYISVSEYLKRAASRLYALERSEPPPRIIPHVLADWGLAPLTDPSETAPLGDRSKAPSAPPGAPELIPGGKNVDIKHEWWEGTGETYLTWGILNPNGPTLYILGSREFDGRHRIFFRWLHMLGGCTTYGGDSVESVTYQGIYDEAESISKHLIANGDNGLFHTQPSFLIINGRDETIAQIAKDLILSSQCTNANWGKHMAYVRKFGSNFFGRAGAEIREFYESEMAKVKYSEEGPSEYLKLVKLRYGSISDFSNAEIPEWTEEKLTSNLFEEWWRLIDSAEFQVKALQSLKTMWAGASSVMSEEKQKDLVPFDNVIDFQIRYGFLLPE
jgi:hypothetical protein